MIDWCVSYTCVWKCILDTACSKHGVQSINIFLISWRQSALCFFYLYEKIPYPGDTSYLLYVLWISTISIQTYPRPSKSTLIHPYPSIPIHTYPYLSILIQNHPTPSKSIKIHLNPSKYIHIHPHPFSRGSLGAVVFVDTQWNNFYFHGGNLSHAYFTVVTNKWIR